MVTAEETGVENSQNNYLCHFSFKYVSVFHGCIPILH